MKRCGEVEFSLLPLALASLGFPLNSELLNLRKLNKRVGTKENKIKSSLDTLMLFHVNTNMKEI